jgi:glycosyltransferase involved in cell wall biosynthesis
MSDNEIDISVVVTAHKEGILAHRTIRSILRSIDYAEANNISAEIIIILDNPDDATKTYFSDLQDHRIRTENVLFADPGLSRNRGVELAKGKWIAFLDADDLFSETWLTKAFLEGEKSSESRVYHPEYFVFFEGEYFVSRSNSTLDKNFNKDNLFQFNYWNSVHFFTLKEILIQVPFTPTKLDSGFGYEDWHWHCEIVASDIPVVRVDETVIFYRKKTNGSRLKEHLSSNVLIPPTKLFDYQQIPETSMTTREKDD